MARLLTFHAHPDDEASKGAPTIAKSVAEGNECFLVCATGGEAGDILNPVMDRPEVRENLAQVRADELAASAKILGFKEVIYLGYRDSGMPDTEENAHPDCFASAPIEEAIERFVKIIRTVKPHVIITYADEQLGYQHPDHLRVFDISLPAWERAGDPNYYPDAGQPWTPQKIYYSTWAKARLQAWHEAYQELDLESPYDDKWFDRPFLDDRITTRVEISDYYWARRNRCWPTQPKLIPTKSSGLVCPTMWRLRLTPGTNTSWPFPESSLSFRSPIFSPESWLGKTTNHGLNCRSFHDEWVEELVALTSGRSGVPGVAGIVGLGIGKKPKVVLEFSEGKVLGVSDSEHEVMIPISTAQLENGTRASSI